MSEGRVILFPIARREPVQVELEFFGRSVLHNEPFPVSGEDGLQALALAQHLLEVGQQGKCVRLDTHGFGARPRAR